MKPERKFSGTFRYIANHWPTYLLLYGSIVVLVMVVGLVAAQALWGLLMLALAGLLVVTYFFLATLWWTYQLYDDGGVRSHHVLFDMGQIQARDQFVYVDFGERYPAIALARRLTTGEVIVVDIYSPQWMPNQALVRARDRVPHPLADPRLSWQSGRIDLLPVPDKSVTAVILCQVTSELWQYGDRVALLREVYRVLAPNGRLLFAEQARTQTSWLVKGPFAASLPTIAEWRKLLTDTGFRIRREQNLQGLIHCFRADKPTPIEAQQLPLGLDW